MEGKLGSSRGCKRIEIYAVRQHMEGKLKKKSVIHEAKIGTLRLFCVIQVLCSDF